MQEGVYTMIQPIKTKNAPEAIGPYSQAVVHNNLVYCSGQIAIDPVTQDFIGGPIEVQAVRVLENLKAILEGAGSCLDNALKVTIYLKNMQDFAEVNKIYGEYFIQKPARSTVEINALPKNALIEIDCIAAI
jgi:2-iminobutanoate/2-iminopropanoate deaminase